MDKIRLFDLKIAVDILRQISTVKLPILLSYKLSKILKETEKDYEFYDKNLSDIIRAHGELDENGNLIWVNDNSIKIKEGKEEDCQKALNELDNIQVDFPQIYFTLEDLTTLNSHIELNSEEVKRILPFIQE